MKYLSEMIKDKDGKKQSFVMYNSFIEAASNLDDAHFRECILRIRDYALYGTNEKSDFWGVNIVLEMAKPLLDAAHNRYEKCVENGAKGKDFGKLGGRPKKTPSKPQDKPFNDNVDEKVYVNDNVDENVNDNVDENELQETNKQSINSNQIINGKQPNAVSQSSLSETNPSILEELEIEDFNDELLQSPSSNFIEHQHYKDRDNTDQTSSNVKDECLNYLFETNSPNEMDMSEGLIRSIAKSLSKLVAMDKGQRRMDSSVFYNAVGNYEALYGIDKQQAINAINILKSKARKMIDDQH